VRAPGFTVWLTGLPGAGKRTVSDELARILTTRHIPVEQLDVRTPGVDVFASTEPGETGRHDRSLGFLASLLNRHGIAVLVATVSPSRETRDVLRAEIPRFIEVYVKRHEPPPGQRYEAPLKPEVEIATSAETAPAAADKIVRTLEVLGYVPRAAEAVYSEEEERQIIQRLKDFGYI
jgi:adenylylsulfate kinase-like enzyme